MDSALTQYPEADHLIVHISDTHLTAGRAPLHGVIDSDANLARLLEGLERSSIRPQAIIFTGDLADAGEADAYARLRALVEPVAARLAARLIWMNGNHDDVREFRRSMLDSAPTDEPIDAVHDLDGLRLITLDTTVPGEHHGDLTADQLAWLAEVLRRPAPHGTVLAMHHPPLPSPLGIIAPVELRHAERLVPILRGSDVRSIISGHLHYPTTATLAGVPVSVAGATAYGQDLQVIHPGGRGQDGGQSYNLIHVYPETVVHSTVALGSFPTVYEISAELIAAFAAMTPEERLAALGAAVHSDGPPSVDLAGARAQ
ncbi:MAG: metallophosphoesterase [Bifidobacteriaceae bacterium]|jgi:3',5'-cyclic AMP phosphodiesterase CpdA|nr:metallophosphoesterase [Bifidobacteriaceae bacterium]